ncbi:hypothetical protein QQF64_018530 [Cirrhinus molitorella]|uniref:Uncharacterized protein n=1 Tax=Cirrhinus molitorella TaxID=172907 RepID=A0ABR3LGC0_9TELE
MVNPSASRVCGGMARTGERLSVNAEVTLSSFEKEHVACLIIDVLHHCSPCCTCDYLPVVIADNVAS